MVDENMYIIDLADKQVHVQWVEWVSDCFLPTQQFFSYIMTRTS
jgi:hypothetical protein